MDKMPAYRWRDAIRLAAFLRRTGPQIAQELEPKMAAVLKDGEKLPDLAHLLDVLGRPGVKTRKPRGPVNVA